MTAGGDDLAGMLRGRIRRDGPISFARFMEAALYHPEFGYYTSSSGGPDDYFTSVTAHPAFGAMLANHLDDVWRLLDRPEPFRVVELGAGDGRLAGHIRAAAAGFPWGAKLAYTGVEIRPAPQASISAGVRFVTSIEEARDAVYEPCAERTEETAGGCVAVISNEYFDALPFHLLRREGNDWIEELVDITDDGFSYIDAAPTPDLLAYADTYGTNLPDGGRLEARPAIAAIYSEIATLAPRIAMTTIDYGGLAADIHGERLKAGTALAYRGHRAGEDLLRDPGRQDLTAHVSFTALIDAGAAVGLAHLPPTPQADFLVALGIGEYLPHLQTVPGVTPERYARERAAVMQLLDPQEMGRFPVLFQLPSGVSSPTSNTRQIRGFQPSL
ncbi:MAG: SAM-dependent methyltransferase [Chloroflexota bacterium]|nr:SAM-dependent methyltransferase [Chloroflexota bacterium]MDP6509567.1 SAM-dependent methyltransferase [Chloroflexota bacterium]MDP6758782.1 SAM-dependent methyltransferase [Chloroflexota bacterium]